MFTLEICCNYIYVGAFGKVYKGVLSRNNQEPPIDVAIKTLKGTQQIVFTH